MLTLIELFHMAQGLLLRPDPCSLARLVPDEGQDFDDEGDQNTLDYSMLAKAMHDEQGGNDADEGAVGGKQVIVGPHYGTAHGTQVRWHRRNERLIGEVRQAFVWRWMDAASALMAHVANCDSRADLAQR